MKKAIDKEEDWRGTIAVDWEEKFIRLDTGITMCYMTSGNPEGIPVILIHGATDSRLSWAQIVPEMPDYCLYVIELRGHGKTDKPAPGKEGYSVNQHAADVISFIVKIGIKKAHIVGHSLGSMIAQQIAVNAPELIDSIALIASGATLSSNAVIDWVVNGDGEDYLGLYGYDEEGALPEIFIKSWTATTNEDSGFGNGIYLHAKSLPYLNWRYIFGGVTAFDNIANLDKIICPVLIIWGTGDIIFAAADQEALKVGLVNTTYTYVEIEGASHNIHWDSKAIATRVAGIINGFILDNVPSV